MSFLLVGILGEGSLFGCPFGPYDSLMTRFLKFVTTNLVPAYQLCLARLLLSTLYCEASVKNPIASPA